MKLNMWLFNTFIFNCVQIPYSRLQTYWLNCGKNVRKKTFKEGVHKFSKKLRANPKFLVLKGFMKQVPYWGPNNSK